MVCLSFYQVLVAEAVVETTNTEVKENLEEEAVVAAELLLSTLTLKEPIISLLTATYIYHLAKAAQAAKVGTDFPPEALAKILLRSLKAALVQQCVQLHAVAAKAALATLETQRPIQLAVQAALLRLPLPAPYTQKF